MAPILHLKLRPESIGDRTTSVLMIDERLAEITQEWIHHHATPAGFENRPFSVNITWLWILIFMALRSENDFISVYQHLPTTYLDQAIVLSAPLLEKYSDTFDSSDIDKNPDSERNLFLRSWTVVSILARWLSAAQGNSTQLIRPDLYLKNLNVETYSWLNNNTVKFLYSMWPLILLLYPESPIN